MAGVDFAQLAARLGVSVDQVLEVASLSVALRELAGDTPTARIVFAAVDLERSRMQPETDAEYAANEWYFEHWSV